LAIPTSPVILVDFHLLYFASLNIMAPSCIQIKVKENRRGTPEWTTQRHWKLTVHEVVYHNEIHEIGFA